MRGEFVYKKEGEVMKNTIYRYVYQFDNTGRLITKYETRTDDGTQDTTFMDYKYEGNRLSSIINRDKEGSTEKKFVFNPEGQIIEEQSIRHFKGDSLQPERSTLLNTENFTYKKFSDRQEKKVVLNSYGLPYKEIISNYDANGYLIEEEEFFVTTYTRRIKTFEYNEHGYLATLKTKTAGQAGFDEEILFQYDEFGNISEKQIFKHGVFTTEIEFLYNDKSKLLTAIIIREVKTNFIMILRFKEYDYFE